MIVKKVIISANTKEKVYRKHNVCAEEIENVIMKNKAIFRRVGGKQYLAIGYWSRYLTIFFKYDHKTKEANITTAYPSSKKDIKFYIGNK